MNLTKSRQGTVCQCEHQYTSMVTGKLKNMGTCQVKHVTACTDKKVVLAQLDLLGWERVRSPGGIQLFCPDHTRKAVAERERAKRERNVERIWR